MDLSGNRLDMPFDLKVRSNFLAYGDEVDQGGAAMRFGMSVNMDIPDAPRLAKRVLELLEGHEVLLENEIAARFKKQGMQIDDMDVDIMITVGGDGTILRALQHNKAPIFGINAGDLGFLTEVADEELEEGLENILKGNYERRLPHQAEDHHRREAAAGRRQRGGGAHRPHRQDPPLPGVSSTTSWP